MKHVPRTDAQWALSQEKRVRALEQSTTTRIGSSVLAEVDGKLMVAQPGQEPFEIKAPEPVAEDTSGAGNAARMYRAATGAVLLNSTVGTEQVLPSDTFDTVDYAASGIGLTLPDGSFKVTGGGVYTIVLRAQAASAFKSNNAIGSGHTVTPLLYVNSVVREYGTPASSAMDGLFNALGSTALSSQWKVRLSAGDLVQVGHRNDHEMDASGSFHRIVGDTDGTRTFLMIAAG